MTDSQTSDTGSDGGSTRKVDPNLLAFLVCPVTHATLRYDAQAQELVSETAGLAYPIRDGIPIMLPEEARSLKEDDDT